MALFKVKLPGKQQCQCLGCQLILKTFPTSDISARGTYHTRHYARNYDYCQENIKSDNVEPVLFAFNRAVGACGEVENGEVW